MIVKAIPTFGVWPFGSVNPILKFGPMVACMVTKVLVLVTEEALPQHMPPK